ncbi:MAG: transposase [Caudoviricetes sp.]|nr:MAG: transposase [Caudoviricetes sp.]
MTEAVKAQVDELANRGMSGAAIARELGINPTLIRRYRAFPRVKKKNKHVKLGKKDKLALAGLLETLRKFRATERGAAQAKTIDPQIKALRGVLS